MKLEKPDLHGIIGLVLFLSVSMVLVWAVTGWPETPAQWLAAIALPVAAIAVWAFVTRHE
jgi:hypothetical protein